MSTSSPTLPPMVLYTAALTGLLALTGCQPQATPAGSRRDRGAAEDTGAGGGTDSGGGSDDGWPEDTGIGGVEGCTAQDLLWSAEVQDEASRPVDHLAPGMTATLVGRVENPCDEDVVVETDEACLVVGFEVIESRSGLGDYQELTCPLAGYGVRLRPGQVEEARHSWYEMAPGSFDLTVHFVVHGLDATTTLLVD